MESEEENQPSTCQRITLVRGYKLQAVYTLGDIRANGSSVVEKVSGIYTPEHQRIPAKLYL